MNDHPGHAAALDSLNKKLNLLRDHATAVGRGYKSGLYLHGDGGIGKSHTIFEHLEKEAVPYQLFNSRMTAKGLFQVLGNAPDAVHVLEDVERLTKDPDAQGVLRSALWSQPGHRRFVTWTTATDGCQKFEFRGGLILISNRPMADLPELRALATRIEVYRLEVTDSELTALMLALAANGYQELGQTIIAPDECLRVTEFLLKECRAAGCRLDLRLQRKAFQSYRQHAAYHAMSHWEDLIAASVREAACHFRHEQNTDTAEARKSQRRNLVREIVAANASAKEQEQAYWNAIKGSRADFYRRKREVDSGEFDEADAAA